MFCRSKQSKECRNTAYEGTMENTIILDAALLLIGGVLLGRVVKPLKMPNVTGYLIAGLILGPACLNMISADMVNGFGVISDVALSFIAFTVGCGFSMGYFKKVGAAPIIIACFESFTAIILVSVAFVLAGMDVKFSIMMGAIAAATAPAQTIMVINQYKAKGPLTSMLLSVVAIDDATALIGFGVATSIVNMMNNSQNTNLVLSLLSPVYEIGVSVVVGAVGAFILKFFFRFWKKNTNRLCIILGFLLAIYWLANQVNGSSLMACMSMGAFLVNIFDETDELVHICDTFIPPLYMVFFVISGAGFQISQLASIGMIGVLYVVLRMAGKMAGAFVGGKLTKQSANVCKYLGPTLMPQAGVALGLIIVAGTMVPQYADQIRTVILCSTFLYSLIGPVAAKISLQKAGEIVPQETAAAKPKK